MTRWQYKSLLLSLTVMLITLNTSVLALTNDTEVSAQIELIENIKDKQVALQTLTKLIDTSSLTAEQKITLLLKKTWLFFGLDRYDEGIDTVVMAKKIASASNLPNQQAQADKLLGILFYYQGELDKALNAYQHSLAFYQDNQQNNATGFAIERANLFNNIALVYTSMEQPGQALIHYELAEPLYAQYGDEVDKIDVKYNIATLYLALKRFDSAINSFKDVLKRRKKMNDHHGVAAAQADLGIAYKHLNQFSFALANISSALRYFQQHGNQHDTASQLHNMSETYLDMMDIENAMHFGQQALILSKKVGHKKAYAGSLQSLAKSAFYSGDLTLAEDYIKRSNITAKQINYQTVLTDNLAILALINSGQGNFSNAISLQRQYETNYLRLANVRLNDKLAELEATQLNQQIEDLKQRRKLQDLQNSKMTQQRNMIILSLVLVLVVIFFVYRHYLEKRLTDELEFRVKQRTLELEKLTVDLEKADKVKSQFLANMSHEIRTPLTAIMGHAEALHQGSNNAIQPQKNIDVIQYNSKHLLALINDVLDLSRIEANKFEISIQPLELGQLVQDIFNTFDAQAQLKQLHFSVSHQFTLPLFIHVDGLRLKQILMNLCANAIKFTEQGSVEVNISWHEDTLTAVVADTGIGLSESQLSQVFKMFTQADNSISRRFGGSGLGLTLSSQLASLMSGKISAQSCLGKGSSFTLTLPCQRIVPPENQLIGEKPKADVLLSGTVLLAEDHDDNRHLIANILESFGLQVILASNGKEAVSQCIKYQPHLVLLDIQMPEMDGVEAYKLIRINGYKQAIFALTANAMTHEVEQYLQLGFTGHLKKPIDREHFRGVITDYLTQQSDISFSKKYDKTIVSNDLITDFKRSAMADKQDLLRCSVEHDIEKICQLAHRLSGAAQMFGFKEISQAAQALETTLKKGNLLGVHDNQVVVDLIECLVDEISVIERE